MNELNIAKEAAEKAGKILLSFFGKLKPGDIHNKEVHDFVTSADIAAEKAIIATIHHTFPHHLILSEELHPETTTFEDTWIVDGLDGTNNFVTGVPIFGVNIAYYHKSSCRAAAVNIPMLKELYWASEDISGAFCNGTEIHVSEQDNLAAAGGALTLQTLKREEVRKRLLPLFTSAGRLRNTGAASFDSILVARGAFDFRISLPEKPVDIAAPAFVIQKAGGTITNIDGTPFSLDSRGWLTSNGKLHEELIKLLNKKN